MDVVSLVVGGSMLIMGPVEIPETAPMNAELQVLYHNKSTNGPQDTGEYVLSSPDGNVMVDYVFNSGAGGADTIILTPPAGWTCDPIDCRLEIQEGFSGIMFLIPWSGM